MRHPSVIALDSLNNSHALLLLLLLLLGLLFGQFLVPGLLHIFHCLRVLVHCLDKLTEIANPKLFKVNWLPLGHLENDLLEFLVLFSKLSDHLLLRALVNDGLVLDLLRSVCIAEGA